MKRLVIGARGSKLATWQADYVRAELLKRHGGLEITVRAIRTRGDALLQSTPHQSLDKGLFTGEIRNELLGGSIDLAVHSLKDLPTDAAGGIAIGAIPVRADPADALVAKAGATLSQLPAGAEVLSGSPRRRALLLHHRRDLRVTDVRGNVGTRLRKLAESDAHAIVLAVAGLSRLGLADRITQRLDPADFVPACGQGALAVEIRSNDARCAELLGPLDDRAARLATTAERAYLAAIEGGCRIPAGAYAAVGDDGATLELTAVLSDLDGERLLKHTASAPATGPDAAEALGRQLAEAILSDGGREILRQIRGPAGDGMENDS